MNPLPQTPLTAEVRTAESPESVTAIEGLIVRQVDKRDQLKHEIRSLNDSLSSILLNDNEYQEKMEVSKATVKESTARKGSLLATPEAMQIKLSIKERREQIKDINASLSNHLHSYEKLTGQLVLDLGDDTPQLEIKRKYTVSKAFKKGK